MCYYGLHQYNTLIQKLEKKEKNYDMKTDSIQHSIKLDWIFHVAQF